MTGTKKADVAASTSNHAVMLAVGLIAVILGFCSGVVRAETIAEGDQVSVRPSDISRPGRGMTMHSVETKFGAPQDRHGPVGQPPISRWDYHGFRVFFENDRVIHTVVDPAS
jgi:hypothetical protein